MTRIFAAVVVLCMMGVSSMAEPAGFSNDTVGGAPKGWTATMTGKGDPKWTIEEDPTAPSKSKVVKQSGRADYRFCLRPRRTYRMALSRLSLRRFRAARIAPLASSGERRTPTITMLFGLMHLRTTSCSTRPWMVSGARSTLLGARADTASRYPYRPVAGMFYASSLREVASKCCSMGKLFSKLRTVRFRRRPSRPLDKSR